jgi:shikimate kinase
MGSGKTVIGRQVARLLNFDFADIDDEIRQVTGMDLPQLLRKHGEIRFRSEEQLIIRKLAARQRLVIACGGTLLAGNDNTALLQENGWVVLLTAPPEVIRARLLRKAHRLPQNGKLSPEAIAAKLAEQDQFSADAIDFRIDSGSYSVEEAAEQIAAAFREWSRG